MRQSSGTFLVGLCLRLGISTTVAAPGCLRCLVCSWWGVLVGSLKLEFDSLSLWVGLIFGIFGYGYQMLRLFTPYTPYNFIIPYNSPPDNNIKI